MAKLRAVVLAAGRGIRMGGEVPKTLLPLEDKPPLLHYILEGLTREGIKDLLVVTGFAPES
ncbi:MAG: NTP transferase domain-containing protein, partial [Actinomycetota bacterium]